MTRQNPEPLHRPECIKHNKKWTRQAHKASMQTQGEMMREDIQYIFCIGMQPTAWASNINFVIGPQYAIIHINVLC